MLNVGVIGYGYWGPNLVRNLSECDETTVAAITSTVRGLPTEVLLDHRDGFPRLCAVNCDDLKTIRKTNLDRRIGRLSETKIESLDDALRFALQLR